MAQGGDGREYPWGPADDAACRPKSTAGNVYPGPDDVDAHSSARCTSPFGVADLVGNTWEFTDEFRDRHTRAAVLRGGSNYNLHAHGGRCTWVRGILRTKLPWTRDHTVLR